MLAGQASGSLTAINPTNPTLSDDAGARAISHASSTFQLFTAPLNPGEPKDVGARAVGALFCSLLSMACVWGPDATLKIPIFLFACLEQLTSFSVSSYS